MRVVESSLNGQESTFPLRKSRFYRDGDVADSWCVEWSTGDAYNIMYRLDVAPATSADSTIPRLSGGVFNISWRR